MAATVNRVTHQYSDFAEITLAGGDEVVVDFRFEGASKSPSPNLERGIRVSVQGAASGTGVTGQVSLGDSVYIEDRTQIAAWATSTQFWATETSGSHPRRSAATDDRIYLRHDASGDVRAVTTLEDADRVGVKAVISEAFRKILAPLSVHDSQSLALEGDDFALVSTGDAVTVDATGGYTGITAGSTYYIIKSSGGSTYVKLATSAANAAAGTALTLSGTGTATDIRLDLPITVANGAAVSVSPERSLQSDLTVASGSTASRLRLNGPAFEVKEGYDLNVDVSSVSQVRRVATVGYEFGQSGETFEGFAYNSGDKTFTAASDGDYRGIEGSDRVIVSNAGGFKGVTAGASYDVANPEGAGATFQLADPANSGAIVALTAIDLNVSAVDVTANTFTASVAADYDALATGDRVSLTNNGGYEGINAANDYFLIKTSTDNVFKLATSRANAIAGTAINFSGSGTPANLDFETGTIGDLRISQTTRREYFDLTEPFTAAPTADADVHVVDGSHIAELAAVVETTTAATTTVLPLKVYDSTISGDHDVHFEGALRDLASVDAAAKTVTLTTALSEAPQAGELISFEHRTTAFSNESDITAAANASAAATIDYPIAALRFIGTGTGNQTATIRLAATYLPEIRERT